MRRPNCCGGGRDCHKTKSLCGSLCILIGVLLLICFLPTWLLAVIGAGLFFLAGCCLLRGEGRF